MGGSLGGLGRLLGGLWEALRRSLGGLCDLGGFLEALGGSLDRFLEALGRMTESGEARKELHSFAKQSYTNEVSNRWPPRCMGTPQAMGRIREPNYT